MISGVRPLPLNFVIFQALAPFDFRECTKPFDITLCLSSRNVYFMLNMTDLLSFPSFLILVRFTFAADCEWLIDFWVRSFAASIFSRHRSELRWLREAIFVISYWGKQSGRVSVESQNFLFLSLVKQNVFETNLKQFSKAKVKKKGSRERESTIS